MEREQLSWQERGQLWLRLIIRLVLAAAAVVLVAKLGPPLLSLFAPFVAALIVAALLNPAVRWLQRRLGWSRKLLSLLLVRAGLGDNVDLVTIGVLMLLVPGVALTNAMRELVAGDTYSGLSRTAEAILIAMGIALGSAVGLGIGRIL